MVSGNPLVEVYCTRPNCQDPVNTIPEKNLYTKPIKQRFCANCGMPLILEKSFVPLRPLVPETERGGFGRTFLARDLKFPDLPLRVIKQLHPRVSATESQLADIERLFRKEASVLGQLAHSQIPRAWAFTRVEAPRDLQESTVNANQQSTFFYLVQDFIDGQNLAQELNQKGQFSETEVVKIMQQLLEILRYIHSEGVIHRDIKPSNIMRSFRGNHSQAITRSGRLYLIDFGAVKQVVVTGVPTAQSVVIGTPDFAPPEQMVGKPISASSDLYSLAATCVCLLAGRNVQQLREYHTHTWNWRSLTNVNSQFADMLDRMLSVQPEDRYQSADEVINTFSSIQFNNLTPQPLSSPSNPSSVPISTNSSPASIGSSSSANSSNNQINQNNQTNHTKNPTKKLLWVAGGMFSLLVGAGVYTLLLSGGKEPVLVPETFFSRGEESLLQEKKFSTTLCQQALQEKQEGMKAFKNQRYDAAKQKFQTATNLSRQATNQCPIDPETLIFLNNAKANIEGNPITIATVIPGKNRVRNTNISEEILRGVASVQETLNNQDGIEGRLLQVVIARDENNSDPETENTSPKVATQLAKNQIPGDSGFNGNILAVIGHFTSDATLAAASIYQEQKLVAISPTSTAVRKPQADNNSQYKYNLSKYVFRTAPNDAIAAADLIEYIRQNIGSGDAGIFYNSNKSYSTSLKESFEDKYASGKLTECDLAKSEINSCPIGDNVKFLMLSIGTEEATKASLIISRYKKPLLGGDSLYNPDNVSSTFGNQTENLVLSVPTHIDRTEQSFKNKSIKLWGTQSINWRTATAYDATQAIVAALQKLQDNSTRQGIYEELSSPYFSTQGATGMVEFDRFHDRKVDSTDDNQLSVLVKVQQRCQPEDEPKYKFCLIRE